MANDERGMWTRKNGTRIHVTEMTRLHLLNAKNMAARKLDLLDEIGALMVEKSGGKTPTELEEAIFFQELEKWEHAAKVVEEELERRGSIEDKARYNA
jgi:hypothetical protein